MLIDCYFFFQMEKKFTIIIKNVQEAPLNTSLTSAGGQQSYSDDHPRINENSAIGTTVGTLVSLDEDAGQHLKFTLDDDAGRDTVLSDTCEFNAKVKLKYSKKD